MCVFITGCSYKSLDIMEITDGNLHVLAGYLQKTLSPDPIERRGGCYCLNCLMACVHVLQFKK